MDLIVRTQSVGTVAFLLVGDIHIRPMLEFGSVRDSIWSVTFDREGSCSDRLRKSPPSIQDWEA